MPVVDDHSVVPGGSLVLVSGNCLLVTAIKGSQLFPMFLQSSSEGESHGYHDSAGAHLWTYHAVFP